MLSGWGPPSGSIPGAPFGRAGRWGRLRSSESFPSSLQSANQRSHPMLEADATRPAPAYRVETWQTR